MKNQAHYRIIRPAKYGAVVKMKGSKGSIHLGWFDTPEAANKAMVDYHENLQKAARPGCVGLTNGLRCQPF